MSTFIESRSPAVAPPACLSRWSAVSGVAAGLCIALPGAVEAFTGETAATSLVLAFACALAIPLLTALFRRHPSGGNGLSGAAYLVNQIGLGLFGGATFALNAVVFFLAPNVAEELLRGPTKVALLLSAGAFVVGTALFGVSMLRARVFPRFAAWSYTLSLPLLALSGQLPDSPLTSVLHILVGATLVRLALEVDPGR